MYNLNDKNQWTADFEPVRRQRRGPRGHGGHGGHGRREGGPAWGGPGGGPGGGPAGGPGFGPPPWVGQMFGPQWGGPGGGRGSRRTRVRRGDVRPAILDVLATTETPLNGYQVIQQIADRTDGAWKPSPGSVYPTIAQLVDEELVEDAPSGRKTLQLTDAGRTWVAENAEQIATVWAAFDEDAADDHADLRSVIKQTVGAIVQVASTGSPAQQDRAVEILADTRRKLYGLLAEGPEAAEED